MLCNFNVKNENITEAKKWWKKLSERTKWNLAINHLNHWVDLTDDEILELYQNNGVINTKNEQLFCPVCKSRRIKQDPKWEDNECLNCGKIWKN